MPSPRLGEPALLSFLFWPLGCLGNLIGRRCCCNVECLLVHSAFSVTVSQNDQFFCFLTENRETMYVFACHTDLV